TTQVIPTLAFFTGILGSDLAEGAAISIFMVPLLIIATYLVLRSAHRAEVT
ncbi:MAG TPA: sugar ABC transporter permease, partial [Thermoanaerobaculia bacterium]